MKKRKKRGPVPPACGRIRITVNLPRSLLPFLKGLEGDSLSKKISGLIHRQSVLMEGFPDVDIKPQKERSDCH